MTDKTCGIDGCDRPVKACGWCVKHNGRSQHLGYFDTPEQAGAAATAAATILAYNARKDQTNE